MTGYKELSYLLKNMKPTHVPGAYIFATVSEETLETLGSAPRLVFREDEAITVIVTKEIAEANSLSFGSLQSLGTSNRLAFHFDNLVTRLDTNSM